MEVEENLGSKSRAELYKVTEYVALQGSLLYYDIWT